MKIGLRGGHSPNGKGALGILDEQTETRKIYDALAPMLQEAGHTVINCNSDAYTIDEELSQGTHKANSNNCDIYVAIHMNASNGAGNGTEVWMYNGENATMNSIAERICQNFAANGFQNRGTKFSTELHDLNATVMPAMIVETLFCDNQHDADLYKKIGVNGISGLIAEGIIGRQPAMNNMNLQLNVKEENIVCWKLFKVIEKDKNKVFFFDGTGIKLLTHPDQRKILETIYKQNTGRTLPYEEYKNSAPWQNRLQEVVNLPYINVQTYKF